MASLAKPVTRCLLGIRSLWISHPARLLSSSSSSSEDDGPTTEPPIPVYQEKVNEPIEQKRARLLYQSRKRGMSENGLLLSTFADKFLADLTDDQLHKYDRLINIPSNDWEIYYWLVGKKPTPSEYDNDVMEMLKVHTRNDKREVRLRMPDLKL